MKYLFNLIIILAIAGGGYYTYTTYYDNNDTGRTEASSISRVDNVDESRFSGKLKKNSDEPFSFLILGVDSKDGFSGARSDSIILAIVNPKKDEITMTSIYRDLYVEIPGRGYNKINAAYAFGGVDLLSEVIKNRFGIEVDHYALVNFKGFEDLVDSIGGVEIEVEKYMKRNKWSINEGTQLLDGRNALEYVRFRSDSEGDFGRARRQRQMISELVDQTLELRNVKQIPEIYQAVNNNFDSDLNKAELLKLALNLRNISGEDIIIETFEAKPTRRNGISYVESTEEELNRVSELLQNALISE